MQRFCCRKVRVKATYDMCNQIFIVYLKTKKQMRFREVLGGYIAEAIPNTVAPYLRRDDWDLLEKNEVKNCIMTLATKLAELMNCYSERQRSFIEACSI